MDQQVEWRAVFRSSDGVVFGSQTNGVDFVLSLIVLIFDLITTKLHRHAQLSPALRLIPLAPSNRAAARAI